MAKGTPAKFTHSIDRSKFVLSKLKECPEGYIRGDARDEFFEMIWFTSGIFNSQKKESIYLIPPFRSLDVSLDDKDGYLISFKREYLEEDDKEYALDVFNLFNLQGQYALIDVSSDTLPNLRHLYSLMLYEYNSSLGTYLALKSLLKVFLLHLIRQNQKAFLHQDINQKRVYDFCLLLDRFFFKEWKSSFYSQRLGLSEKRLNQILKEKMNKTITQLVHARLILEAKRKLKASELTIKEISYQLNFEDPSYFSRFFKNQTGLTPEEFKAQVAENMEKFRSSRKVLP